MKKLTVGQPWGGLRKKRKTINFILSAFIAFVILNLFCIFYYNIPVHYASKDGATDYVWEPNKFYSRATEGFAFGNINNEGYYNLTDYDKSKQYDILIMGSSHMEAAQVQQKYSTTGILSSKLKEYNIYNIGISGHTFITCFSNLENAIKKYQPKKYIIIEVNKVTYNEEELTKALSDSVEEIPSYNGGIVGILQHYQFLRLVYQQTKSFLNVEDNDDNDLSINNDLDTNTNYILLDKLLNIMQQKVANSKTKIIIMYHPYTTLNSDGSLKLSSEEEDVKDFKKLCQKNGIYFLDMSNRFRKEYEDNYILPYGFNNTSVGYGHLNKYGHEMIADELYKLIKGVE